MALLDLWQRDRVQITGKRLEQLIAFAGNGSLLDGSDTSREFRELLSAVPSDLLDVWIKQILTEGFSESGYALQDIVNEIGNRLGFEMSPGFYRGRSGESGQDGVWRSPEGQTIVVECKSSTAFKINLGRVRNYCTSVANRLGMPAEDVSALLIVGDEDTEDLEAQVRGSRYAWSVRLIGIAALHRLLKLKEALDDPHVERQIREVLVPQEFTRLDRIINLIFATAEDVEVQQEEKPVGPEVLESPETRLPANFHAEILPQLERKLSTPLVKRSRVTWSSPSGERLVSCQVSSEYSDNKGDAFYWFGLKAKTAQLLRAARDAACAFGLGSPDRVVLVPFSMLEPHLSTLFTSPNAEGGTLHWHVRFRRTGERIDLLVDRDRRAIDVTDMLLRTHVPSSPASMRP